MPMTHMTLYSKPPLEKKHILLLRTGVMCVILWEVNDTQ